MDAEEYLDRHGVTAFLKDVVTLLLENRPESPIAFIAHYFRTVTHGSNSPLLRAYRYIKLAPPEQEVFTDNLVASYAALESRRPTKGVIGSDLVKLLRLISADYSLDVSRSLLFLLGRAESDQIGFVEFSSAVRSVPKRNSTLYSAACEINVILELFGIVIHYKCVTTVIHYGSQDTMYHINAVAGRLKFSFDLACRFARAYSTTNSSAKQMRSSRHASSSAADWPQMEMHRVSDTIA